MAAQGKSRLFIYALWDLQGIADGYVEHMLKSLAEAGGEIRLIANALTEESREKLRPYASEIEIIDSENAKEETFFGAAYRAGVMKISSGKYDELVLLNSSVAGPVFSLKQVFEQMRGSKADCWGLTGFRLPKKDGSTQRLLSFSFAVFRSSAFEALLELFKGEDRSLLEWEKKWFSCAEKEGLTQDFFCDCKKLWEFTGTPVKELPLETVRDEKCPLFDWSVFTREYARVLHYTNGQEALELYQYLQSAGFPMELLWEHLLRVGNQGDLKKNLHLNYILSSSQVLPGAETESNLKTVLMLHCYFPELIDDCAGYAASMPPSADIIVTTNTEEKKWMITERFKKLSCHRLEVLVIENRGRDISSLLVACRPYLRNYDLVCFAHDKKAIQHDNRMIGRAFSYKCFENVLKNDVFVRNVIRTFEENPRLGMLTPPPPEFSKYFTAVGVTDWGCNFENVQKLSEELGFGVDMDFAKEPTAPYGTLFWFRPKALEPLLKKEWKYEDFPPEPNLYDGTLLHAIERAYPLAVQSAGYYPAWVLNDEFARMEITNLYYMLRELNSALDPVYHAKTHQELIRMIREHLTLKEVIWVSVKDIVYRRFPKWAVDILRRGKQILFDRKKK